MSNLLKDNKELMQEYNYEKNKQINLDNLTLGSGEKIWWICSKKHEWRASVCNRSKERGCPVCANRVVLVGFNDLKTTNPELVLDWDLKKNKKSPTEVTYGSGYKAFWKCHICGGKWQTKVLSRSHGTGCPYCSGRKAVAGKNDLFHLHPDLMEEWDYIKNKNINPKVITQYSHIDVHWICKKCKYLWEAKVSDRVRGRGCPKCFRETQISFPEKAIYFYSKKYFKKAIENYKAEFLNKMELDIYIPELKTAIEYDGEAWHKDVKKDIIKDKLCKKIGIRLIRVREPRCPRIKSPSLKIYLDNLSREDLEEKIRSLFSSYLMISASIDLERDIKDIYKIIDYSRKENSISNKRPDLLLDWDYEKNYPLLPTIVTKSSSVRVHWKCHKCGYESISSVNSRKGCKQCNKPHNIPPTRKQVVQIDMKGNTVGTYESIREAERKTGINRKGIMGVCNNAYGYKTAGGYIWKYKNDGK